MRIKTIEPIAVSLPMLKPVIMAGEEVRRADNVLVRIAADNGLVGWGEAASAPVMTGETIESIVSAVHYLAPALQQGRRSLVRRFKSGTGTHLYRTAILWHLRRRRGT